MPGVFWWPGVPLVQAGSSHHTDLFGLAPRRLPALGRAQGGGRNWGAQPPTPINARPSCPHWGFLFPSSSKLGSLLCLCILSQKDKGEEERTVQMGEEFESWGKDVKLS